MSEENISGKNTSRRDFLKSSAAAGAGLVLTNSILGNINSNVSSKKDLQ